MHLFREKHASDRRWLREPAAFTLIKLKTLLLLCTENDITLFTAILILCPCILIENTSLSHCIPSDQLPDRSATF